MSIATQNSLFDYAITQIKIHSAKVAAATHLFASAKYDTALDKLDLRMSAKRLREAADELDGLAERLQGPETSFPDFEAMGQIQHMEAAE